MFKKNILIILFLFLIIVGFVFFIRAQFNVLKKKVTVVSCVAVKEQISKAISDYKLKNPDKRFYPGEIIDVENFYQEGYLKEYHNCPAGGVYKINRYGEVYCTYHDAEE